MASRKTASAYMALPGRSWLYRATLMLLVTAGLFLFIMSKTGNPAIERFKTSVMDVITPVLSAAASPFEAMHNVTSWFGDMAALREENIALRNQNRELLKWQTAAKDMAAENQSLHELLKVVPSQKHSYVTARIVADISGPYVHSALLNGGQDNGIKQNQAVINENGLVGRTLDVGATSARVLLLTDINSRVPVVTEKTREKSMLTGNNDTLPTLSYVNGGNKIEGGERIITSGDGGMFPAGIPVGVVSSIDKETGVIKVQLFADPANVDFVSAVDYSF